MDTLVTNLNEIITDSLKRSMSYTEYTQLFKDLIPNKTTEVSELLEYTKLNERRSKRWDKTLKISPQAEEKIKAYNQKVIWLLITETWCGDAAHIVPVINKVAQLNKNISLKIVLRDQNEALINRFLTNGGKAIPKLVVLNSEYKVLNTFGPRPQAVTQMVESYKKKNASLTSKFKEELQVWYNKDKGQSTLNDLLLLLS